MIEQEHYPIISRIWTTAVGNPAFLDIAFIPLQFLLIEIDQGDPNMIPAHMDPTMLVCISLLSTAPQVGTKDIAPIMNHNFPPSELDDEDIRSMLDYLDTQLPDWCTLFRTLNPNLTSIRILLQFLEEGRMKPLPVPFDETSVTGLQRAMGRLIMFARNHAISKGLLQRRSFQRTHEGDRIGYKSDLNFYWWDHPGNLGC